jgi:hypothetical protein
MQQATGAESVRWDLSDLYTDIDDPALDADLARLLALANVSSMRTRANSPIRSARRSTRRRRSLPSPTSCSSTCICVAAPMRPTNASSSVSARCRKRGSRASADYQTFFEHELVAIDDATYAAILARDPVAARHRPLLDHIRRTAAFS